MPVHNTTTNDNVATPSSTFNNADPHSNPEQSEDAPQHPIQPQHKYGWLTTFIFGLFQWIFLPVYQALVAVIIRTLGDRLPIIDGHEQQGISVATQFQGAQGVTIGGNPVLTTIGMNTGIHNVTTTVNNYGGTHGLENLKDFVSFAALHDSAEQDPTRRCHPGTRKAVLSWLRDWFDNPDATEPICWLHGPAGAGKSAIAQTIADEYKERGVAATFFFFRSDAERNNGNRLFPTLAWQLAFSIPAIKNFIVHALDKTPHLPSKDVEAQFEQLVVHPFHPTNNIASQMPLAPVVIIDGVDECSDEQLQRRILNVIGNAVKECRVPLHFLICSRPEALIEGVLDQFKDITLRIDLAKLDDSFRDIEKYLVDQFSDLAFKRGLTPTWPGPEIIKEFVSKSSGYFIFAATVLKCISDEDCDPEEQLDIVRNLKPHGKTSPFALLDGLYLEILKQQRDQDFLKAFLALFLGRSSIKSPDLQEDDELLMNVSKKNLRMKLRRMHSLLKFEPYVDVHHKSFLEFLQDQSRSGEYHVSEQGAQKRYLELIVDCVVRHVSMAIEQPNGYESLMCSSIAEDYPSMIVLPVDDWKEALRPLLDLQNRLLNTLKSQPCHFSQVMRGLLLHLAILQRNPHHSVAVQVLESNVNEPVTERSPTLVAEAGQNILENNLDGCLYTLLSSFQKTNSVLVVNKLIIERMSSLLAHNYAETAARVRSITDAQNLIDIIDLLIHNETFLSHCGPDAAWKAALLASEIYSRVPLLPRSVFLNGPSQQLLEVKISPKPIFFGCDQVLNPSVVSFVGPPKFWGLEVACQSTFISRILDHNHIIPLLWIYQEDELQFVYSNVNEQDESLDKWLERSRPNFVTRIRVMLEVARTIRYIHSMDMVATLRSVAINSKCIALDSNLHAKIMFHGSFTWQVREKVNFILGNLAEYTPEHNIAAFGNLFKQVCFDDDNESLPNHLVEDARQLIKRCCAKDPKTRPTMEDVVKEVETWNLS